MVICSEPLQQFQDSVRCFLEELNDLLAGKLDGWKCDTRDFELASIGNQHKESRFLRKAAALRVYPRKWQYSSFLEASFVPNRGSQTLGYEWIQLTGGINAPHIHFPESKHGFVAHFEIIYSPKLGETWRLRPVNNQMACYPFLRRLCEARYGPAQ